MQLKRVELCFVYPELDVWVGHLLSPWLAAYVVRKLPRNYVIWVTLGYNDRC